MAEKNQNTSGKDGSTALATALTTSVGSVDKWYVDSAATQPLCSQRQWFTDFEEITPRDIHLADDHKIQAMGIGTIEVDLRVGNGVVNGTLNKVLYVPQIHGNLRVSMKTNQVPFSIPWMPNWWRSIKTKR